MDLEKGICINMLSYGKVLSIFSIGMGASILIMMMFYAGFSQFFIDNILYNLDINDFTIASIIILSFVFITFVSCYISGSLVSTGIDRSRVFYSSIMSLVSTFLLLLGLSTLIVIYVYPDYIDGLSLNGFEYLFALPSLCVFYMAIYVLDEFIYLNIVIIVMYFSMYTYLLWLIEKGSKENYER